MHIYDYGETWIDGVIKYNPPRILATITPPLPTTDDFGNERVLNTWFYGEEVSSPNSSVTVPDCDIDDDGYSDNADLDDDNDGILDVNEGFSTTTGSAPACGSQTVLNFNNAFTEEPGGDGNNTTFLQGETFRFPNVAAGIDALVTIVTLNGTTLPTLDDNGSNPNSFQPQSAFNLANIGDQAYTEFRFDFVSTGGTVGVNDVIIPEFFVNFNDVDGNSNYGEQNWSQLPVGYFVDDPTELTINTVDNFVVGNNNNTSNI